MPIYRSSFRENNHHRFWALKLVRMSLQTGVSTDRLTDRIVFLSIKNSYLNLKHLCRCFFYKQQQKNSIFMYSLLSGSKQKYETVSRELLCCNFRCFLVSASKISEPPPSRTPVLPPPAVKNSFSITLSCPSRIIFLC